MRSRRILLFLGAWAVLAAAVFGAALVVSGGWRALLDLDPAGGAALGQLTVPDRGPTLIWMGDSVCSARASWDPPDMKVGDLGSLAAAELCGPGSLLGEAWRFVPAYSSGYAGRQFEAQTAKLLRRGAAPRVGVIEVNLRGLNAKGTNGFMPAPDHGLRELGGDLDIGWHRLGPLAALGPVFRSLAALINGVLQELFVPVPQSASASPKPNRQTRPGTDVGAQRAAPKLPAAVAAEASRQEAEAGQRRIYGQGYELDEGGLEALLKAGTLLRERGCRVFYYLTPAERELLQRQLGAGVLAQRDEAVRRVVTRLEAAGFEVLDLQAALSRGFIEPPSEHLDAEARRWLAARLTGWLGERLRAKPLTAEGSGHGHP